MPPWHPKVTPYRLLVVCTTIFLGTWKAIATQNQNTSASTTLEWIGGTVLAIIFFILNSFDSGMQPPQVIRHLFEYDCKRALWEILTRMSVIGPSASTSYDRRQEDAGMVPPMLTAYRLLVCTLTVAFGLPKAALSYLGYSTAMTWVDWMFGVVMSTLLYVLGLYESEMVQRWPGFYAVDQTRNYLLLSGFIINLAFWLSCISGALYGILSLWRWSLLQTYGESYLSDAIGILLSIISISFLNLLILFEFTWMIQADRRYSLSIPISRLARTFPLHGMIVIPRSIFTYGTLVGQIAVAVCGAYYWFVVHILALSCLLMMQAVSLIMVSGAASAKNRSIMDSISSLVLVTIFGTFSIAFLLPMFLVCRSIISPVLYIFSPHASNISPSTRPLPSPPIDI